MSRWRDAYVDWTRGAAPMPPWADAVLALGEPLIALGMRRRLAAPRVRVAARVVSFGNITTGGTGKTPAVIEAAQHACAAGERVAVITRGYGSAREAEPAVLAPGALVPFRVGPDAAEAVRRFGDEPVLIAWHAPQAVVVKARDRVAGARHAMAEFGCTTLLLDDGFQYVRLERDENVLVVDASCPFGNRHLTPRGNLREPVAHAARATSLLLTHCDRAPALDVLTAELSALCPGRPQRRTRHAPARLWRADTGETLPLEALRECATLRAVSAIGSPGHFAALLRALGAASVESRSFPDHAQIPGDALASATGQSTVITEKDAVRLHHAPSNTWVLGIALEDI